MHKWANTHQIPCNLLEKPPKIRGYGEKALWTPAKVVDTKACGSKMVEIIKKSQRF